jgi:hypothetical protein
VPASAVPDPDPESDPDEELEPLDDELEALDDELESDPDVSVVVVPSNGPVHKPVPGSHVASALQHVASDVHHNPTRVVGTQSGLHVNDSGAGGSACARSRSATQNIPSPHAVHPDASQHASTVPVVLVDVPVVATPVVESGGGGGMPSVRCSPPSFAHATSPKSASTTRFTCSARRRRRSWPR